MTPRLIVVLACAAAPAVARADIVASVDPGAPAPAPAPAPIKRIVLIDASPELVHAASAALAPWTIDVTDETWPADQPLDDAAALELGRARTADRVAWLAGGELVVADPATGTVERRPAPDGAADAPTAAAVALTLKTVLRLPPPTATTPIVTTTQVDDPVEPVQPHADAQIAIVPEVEGALRVSFGGSLDPQPRVVVGLGLTHSRWPRWRPSVVAGFGPSVEGGTSGFKGRYSDVEAGLQLALEVPVSRAWAIVPRARFAVHRTHVSGRLPMMEDFDAHAIGYEAGADLAVWWRAGGFRAGAGVGAAALLGLPDYVRQTMTVFESPSSQVQAFLVVLVDL